MDLEVLSPWKPGHRAGTLQLPFGAFPVWQYLGGGPDDDGTG